MKEFVLLFRMDITTKDAQPSSKQIEIYMAQWTEWINYISAMGQLAEGGNHLSPNGRVLKPHNLMEDGPYVINKESIAGYIIILAKDIEVATHIAQKCPILLGEGTSIEVRETANPEIV
jgi:hypothetical protein